MSAITSLLKGTFILTIANFLTRIMGFFYRIFLSRIFTTEKIGLYQLVFPVYTLGLSLSVSGIQTVLSRSTARYVTQSQKHKAILALKMSLLVSTILSFLFIVVVQHNLSFVATSLLKEAQTSNLLLYLLYALPFAVIHCSICAYCMGLRQIQTVASSQLLEQISRIVFVFIMFFLVSKKSNAFSITYAVIGIVVGEITACIYTLFKCKKELFFTKAKKETCISVSSELFMQSIPLTANRVCITLMQSIESISIPVKLELYGFSTSDALSTYGIFSGMAIPCILFPAALTNALSAMLLPTIASYQVSHKNSDLWRYIRKIAFYCFLMGTGCFLLFFFLGKYIGYYLFHNNAAGHYISALSYMCPFLYMNSTLLTTLNALGHTLSSFFINTCSLLLRIISVYLLIPYYGTSGYLFGLFTSQLTVTILSLLRIYYLLSKKHT